MKMRRFFLLFLVTIIFVNLCSAGKFTKKGEEEIEEDATKGKKKDDGKVKENAKNNEEGKEGEVSKVENGMGEDPEKKKGKGKDSDNEKGKGKGDDNGKENADDNELGKDSVKVKSKDNVKENNKNKVKDNGKEKAKGEDEGKKKGKNDEKKEKKTKAKVGKNPAKKKKTEKEKQDKKQNKKDRKKNKNKLTGLLPESIEDKVYWRTSNSHRNWTEKDNPLWRKDFKQITLQMNDFVRIHKGQLNYQNYNIYELISEIFKIQEQIIDLGIPVAYLFGDYMDMNTLFPISTILGTGIDTKEGEDIPPILSPSCTLHHCMDSTYQWIVDEEKTIDQADLLKAGEPGIVEILQEGFISTYYQLSHTFSKKDTQEILCARSKSIATTKLTVANELEILDEETKEFLKNPEQFSKAGAEKYLKKSFDKIRAEMLLDLIDALCY